MKPSTAAILDSLEANITRASLAAAASGEMPHPRDDEEDVPLPEWVMPVADAITPCQGYDVCLDLMCGACYDGYLGTHTSCGKMTYYDCQVNLPAECRPLRCTETNVNEVRGRNRGRCRFPGLKRDLISFFQLFFPDQDGEKMKVEEGEENALMVRNFPPLNESNKNCL